MYFFTVVAHHRRPLFDDGQARDILREAIGWVRQRHPFEIAGMVLLPQHLHFNPVKHGLATCPHSWPYSTFGRWVDEGAYPQDWYCQCRRRLSAPPAFLKEIGDVGE